jgi:hypothetical protein
MVHPYASSAYAECFREWAEPVEIPEWGTWVLRRAIPGSAESDAMGCYPLAVLRREGDLLGGLDRLRRLGPVSVVLVSDVLAGPPPEALRSAFGRVTPFKTHHVRELAAAPGEPDYGRHHRYEVRRARQRCEVRPIALAEHLDRWLELYACLAGRHPIRGLTRFSGSYFRGLLKVDGLTALAAFAGGELVSMHLWIDDGSHVYSHLAASSEKGYRLRASYAIYDAAIRHFAGRRAIDFGGCASTTDSTTDGLARFKQGFANRTAPAYLCGEILDPEKYEELVRLRGAPGSSYFPAYRSAG